MVAPAIVAGGLIAGGAVAGAISNSKAGRRAAAAMAQASAESARQFDIMMANYDKAVAELQSVGIPPMELQQIALKAVELGPSALEELAANPEASFQQFQALAQMDELSQPGLTPADRAEQFLITRGASAQAAAREKSIIQNMQQRGVGGSGMELAARLQGNQATASNAAMQQAQLVSDRQKARQNAIFNKSQMAGQLRGQQFREDTQSGQAKDRIEQFNKSQAALTANEMERKRAGLYQTDFQNRLAKSKAIASAYTGTGQAAGMMGQQALKQGQASAAGHLEQGAATSKLYGGLAGAGLGAFGNFYKGAGAADGGVMYDDDEYEEGGLVNYFADGGVNPYLSTPNSNGGFAEGGLLDDEGDFIDIGDEELGEPQEVPNSGGDDESRYLGGDTVPGNSYAGDRVDAKVNSGEMVINLEQQQRLMDLLKGLKGLQSLGDENIIDGAPGSPGNLGEMARSPGGAPAGPPEGLPPIGGGGPPPPPAGGPPLGGEQPLPQEGIGQPPMIPEGAQPPLAQGGMVPGEYDDDDDTYSSRQASRDYKPPRGIHASLNSEKSHLEKSDGDQKARKARIKALETLRDKGR